MQKIELSPYKRKTYGIIQQNKITFKKFKVEIYLLLERKKKLFVSFLFFHC